ncbi:hypothetical protein B0A48_18742 [Cryoendolithus antarcticus]|uniref:Uncharacterized protein n=1 Tax=Cryoendolithus antarcticus TaxID=1507870 RepID=A0A1V8S7S1_9PEZI|nr:hypothetical protein B0A48_18742 [Cryoendolithus antarcticus]
MARTFLGISLTTYVPFDAPLRHAEAMDIEDLATEATLVRDLRAELASIKRPLDSIRLQHEETFTSPREMS